VINGEERGVIAPRGSLRQKIVKQNQPIEMAARSVKTLARRFLIYTPMERRDDRFNKRGLCTGFRGQRRRAPI
jgi:hypothetical protein